MNPLSPVTFHLRHKRNTLLLMTLVCLATVGLYLMVSVLDSIPMRAQFTYLAKVSRVYPAGGDVLEPGVVSQIETHSDVARVIPDNGLWISPPALIGSDSLRLIGVSQEDTQYLMAHCGVRLKEGRMFEPRTNEIVLSEEVVRALGLGIGDEIERSVNDMYYARVPTPLVLVGILEGDPTVNPGPSVRVGFASYEYLEAHELFAPRPVNLLVAAREGRKDVVDEFLETTVVLRARKRRLFGRSLSWWRGREMKPDYGYLRYVGEVAPGMGGGVDPGVVAQVRSQPAVARVIQTMPLWVQILVPPGGGSEVSIYGVSEDDLPVSMDLFDVQLVERRLPRPRSDEIVISRVTALNRGLHVGDTIGRPVQERNGEDNPMIVDDIPTEMVIVGLLSRDDLWLGFTSLEYLQSHELTASRSPRLLVVPAAERKGELDAWLEESVASAQTRVYTYDAERREFEEIMRLVMLLFVAVESIIAVVAAVALAALNYIFFAQRREEFGILHAIGRSRPWLVFRTVKETGSAVGLAWLVGAAICMLGLIGFQAFVYTPRGLNLDFFSFAPWLFTVPIPLAVIIVGAGTIARTLRRLDPVAVIEMR